MELKDGFSRVNLQFSENCVELLPSASAWLKTGFNPKSKASSIGRAPFSLQPKAFHCLPSYHPICTRSLLPDIKQPLALQDSAQLEASWEKPSSKPASRNVVLPFGNYLHSQMRMTQIARAVTTCWENIIRRTEWATSTPLPSRCAHFRVPLTAYEGKSAVACLQEQQPCLAWLWISKISRQISSSQARPWLGLEWERIGNCLALNSSVIEGALEGAPWEWIRPKQHN